METPQGCEFWRNAYGIGVAQIHFTADPEKGKDWEKASQASFPSRALWNQEMGINADALMGQLVFPPFSKELNVIKPFPIPHDWTRYMGIDPHPRVPHAFLWLAVSPKGDHCFYREYWPSRAYGLRGDVPEDDDRYTIHEYAAAIAWLEGNREWRPQKDKPSLAELGYEPIGHFGPNGFADNQGQPEHIYRRVMDPYGKAVALVRQDGKEEQETFWDRYETLGIKCQPAKKDFNASVDIVCRRLTARLGDRPQILIFDICKELILELLTNRYGTLTPAQAATHDPHDRPLPKRKHMTDLARYLESEDPSCVVPRPTRSVQPLEKGIAY